MTGGAGRSAALQRLANKIATRITKSYRRHGAGAFGRMHAPLRCAVAEAGGRGLASA